MTQKVSRVIKFLFPLARQLEGYRSIDFRSDLFAGVTVAFMLIPQAMAYSVLAGMPPVTGLYAATVPLIVYALLGTSRQLSIGPAALISFLVFSGVSALKPPGTELYIHYTMQLTMLSGFILLVMGLIKAGFLVNYVSRAVMSGFTSAAALIIALNQLDPVLGIRSAPASTLVAKLAYFYRSYSDTRLMPLVFGLTALGLLLLVKRFFPRFPAALLVLAISILLVRALHLHEIGLNIIGAVPAGLPNLQMFIPDFEVMKLMLPTALSIAFVGYMESYSVAQSIAARKRQNIHPDRELTALGSANVAAALFAGFPVTGGLSRTAVNNDSGAKTGLAGVISATCVSLILLFLTPLFFYLPNVALAAIIIVAAGSLFNPGECVRLIRIKPVDGLTWLATFILTLLGGIEIGIPAGVFLSLALFIRRSAHPHIVELGYCHERNDFMSIKRFPMLDRYPHVIILRIDSSVFFANAGFIRHFTDRIVAARHQTRLIIFDFEGVNDMDAVAVNMLENLIDDYDHQEVDFAFARIKGPVRDILTRAGWDQKYPFTIRFRPINRILEELEINTLNGFVKHSKST
jgi:sulfate permease, SulP family